MMASDRRLKVKVFKAGRHPRLGIRFYLFDHLPKQSDACSQGRRLVVSVDKVMHTVMATGSLHAIG
jgi:hypothetical protein